MSELKKRLVVIKVITELFGVVPDDIRMNVPLRQMFKFYLSEPELRKVFKDINFNMYVSLAPKGFAIAFDFTGHISGGTTINQICESITLIRTTTSND